MAGGMLPPEGAPAVIVMAYIVMASVVMAGGVLPLEGAPADVVMTYLVMSYLWPV